jgi:hypothetical protein
MNVLVDGLLYLSSFEHVVKMKYAHLTYEISCIETVLVLQSFRIKSGWEIDSFEWL